jgi:diacylglycerol kinase (ATP)
VKRDGVNREVKGRIRSFVYAGRGVALVIRTQHNAWIHLLATLLVTLAGLLVDLSRIEWALVALAFVAVWAAEALNTAFEHLCDVASPEFHPLVERSKDAAAGAVLIAALGAVTVGALVFLPHFFAGP